MSVMEPHRQLTAMTCYHCSGATGFQNCETMSRAVPEGLKGGLNIYYGLDHFLEFQELSTASGNDLVDLRFLCQAGFMSTEHELTVCREVCGKFPWGKKKKKEVGALGTLQIELPDVLLFRECLRFTLVALTQ